MPKSCFQNLEINICSHGCWLDVWFWNRSSLIGLRNTDFFMNATRISSTGTLSSSLERRLRGVSPPFWSGEAHPYLELIITAARCATVRKTWYSRLPVTRTLANSNQNRFPLDFRHIFVSPQVIFYIILPSITRTVFWALKRSGKKPSTGVRNDEFWTSYWRVVEV